MMKDRMMQNGIEYERRGEQYYPLLNLLGEQTSYEIGKYGKLHLEFIKQHRKGKYTTLLTSGELNKYLHEVDDLAFELVVTYVENSMDKEGVNEELKASDPTHWVQMMNNIKASAEEIVLKEVVYK